MDNVYSKYDDARETFQEEFSMIYKIIDTNTLDLLVQFDYSRNLNLLQITAYKEKPDKLNNNEVFYLFANFTSNDLYFIFQGTKCFYGSMESSLKLNIQDLEFIWFYGFLNMDTTVADVNDPRIVYKKYQLNIPFIKDILILSQPQLIFYIEQENKSIDMIEAKFIETTLRQKQYKKNVFDKRIFGFDSNKNKTEYCKVENRNNLAESLRTYFNESFSSSMLQ